MLPWFTKYPNQNDEILNLDWVIKQVENLKAAYEAFLAANSLTFADPIFWDITKQYSKNTIVLSPEGDAYLSKKVVGAGVQLNNTDYWLEIFNFAEYVRTANSNLTFNIEIATERASQAYDVDDWLIWNDVLYKVTTDIPEDGLLEVGTNIVHFTVEDFCRAWQTYMVNTIQQYKNDIDASELAYKNQIDASELAYKNQLDASVAQTTATLSAQLAQAIAGATVDSEVIDIRVGANGITYQSAGDAVRGQIDMVDDYIDNILHLEGTTSSHTYVKGDYIIYKPNKKLYQVTNSIAIGDAFAASGPNQNVTLVSDSAINSVFSYVDGIINKIVGFETTAYSSRTYKKGEYFILSANNSLYVTTKEIAVGDVLAVSGPSANVSIVSTISAINGAVEYLYSVIEQIIKHEPKAVSTRAYNSGEFFILDANNNIYKTVSSIAIGDVLVASGLQQNVTLITSKTLGDYVCDALNKPNPVFRSVFTPASSTRYIYKGGKMWQYYWNTPEAFISAGEDPNCTIISADLRKTSDGEYVCFHDGMVDSSTDGTGSIEDMTLTEVEQLTVTKGGWNGSSWTSAPAGSNYKIATFKEFLNICRKYGKIAMIEPKRARSDVVGDLTVAETHEIMEIINNLGMADGVIFLAGAGTTCGYTLFNFYPDVSKTESFTTSAQSVIDSSLYDSNVIYLAYDQYLTETDINYVHSKNRLIFGIPDSRAASTSDYEAMLEKNLDCIFMFIEPPTI